MNKSHLSLWMLTLLAGYATACLPLNQITPTPQPIRLTATATQVTPVPTETPTLAPLGCTETEGVINTGVIDTALLDKPMRYNIYLPPCYQFDSQQHYPVIYLLHGQNFDENQWVRIGVPQTADLLINSQQIEPFIVVMPYDYSFKQPSEYRFEEVLINLLIPQIDGSYRTKTERANRAIGGLSRGGGWALYIGMRHPDLFTAIGGHSAAIFYAQETSTAILKMQSIPAEIKPTIYLDAGDSDAEFQNINSFQALLNSINYPYEWHYYVGFHNETYWQTHLQEYLRWYDSQFKQLVN